MSVAARRISLLVIAIGRARLVRASACGDERPYAVVGRSIALLLIHGVLLGNAAACARRAALRCEYDATWVPADDGGMAWDRRGRGDARRGPRERLARSDGHVRCSALHAAHKTAGAIVCREAPPDPHRSVRAARLARDMSASHFHNG